MLRMFILFVAIASGGGAAFLVANQPPQAEPSPTAPVTPATVDILVASSDIGRGQTVNEEALTWQSWPKDAVVSDFVVRKDDTDISEHIGRFAMRAFSVGEPLRAALLSERANGHLAAQLEKGMRAVAIQTSARDSAGGFILPDDRVDVLHTYDMRAGNGPRRIVTETLLQGVRVLAIDQVTDGTREDAMIGKTATLALTRAQAEAVTAAEATGSLSLSLRPVEEEVTPMEVVAEPAPPEPTEPQVVAARTIKIIRPDGIETVTLN